MPDATNALQPWGTTVQSEPDGLKPWGTTVKTSGAPHPSPSIPSSADYTHDQLKNLWTKYGGDPHVADLMAHVAQAESAGHPGSEGSYTDGGHRYMVQGLWQISTIHGKGNWFDPTTNVKKAIELYNAQGMSPWEDSRNKGGREAGAKASGWGQYQGGDFARGAGETIPTKGHPKSTPSTPALKPWGTTVGKHHAPLLDKLDRRSAEHPEPSATPMVVADAVGAVGTDVPMGEPMDSPNQSQAQAPAGVPSVTTGLGQLLDAQGYQVRKGMTGEANTDDQMTAIRHAIPGMDWAYQARLPDTGIPVLDAIQEAGNHASKGLIDAAVEQVLDPLTYETMGVGPALRGLKLEAPLQKFVMRAINSTPLSQMVHDALHWDGPVRRALGEKTGQEIRGAGNRASDIGAMVKQHINERIDNIVNGKTLKSPTTGKITPGVKLNDEERLNVGEALRGGIPREALTGRESAAYRQLRTLTVLDAHLRRGAGVAKLIARYTKEMSPEDRETLEQAFRSGKDPVIPKPEPRVRKEVGEPQPRQRVKPYAPPPDVDAAWAKATANLGQADKALLGKSLTDPELAKTLNPELAAHRATIQEAIRQKFALAGGDEFSELTPRPKTTFQPANQDEIERMTAIKQKYDQIQAIVEDKIPLREDYMPFKHSKETNPEGREAFTLNTADHFDPRTIEREDLKVTSPHQLVQGFHAMSDNTARQVTNREIHKSLGDLLDNQEVKNLFEETFPATGNKRDNWQKIKDGWRAAVGYPRAAIVSLLPRHGFNIMDLVANTVPPEKLPEATAKIVKLAAKLLTANAREYRALTKVGRELGTGGSGSFAERKPFFTKFPDWMPKVGGKGTGILGKWTSVNSRLVWAVDVASKQVYGEILQSVGEAKGLQAGGMASERLVDYEHLAPIQKWLRYVAPFGTFRGGIPSAALGGVARNPARAAFLNRATGGAMFGGKTQPQDDQPGMEMFNPTADVGRATIFGPSGNIPFVSGPANFARSTAGAPVQAAVGALQDIALGPNGQKKHFAMYGQPWGPNQTRDGQNDPGFIIDSIMAGFPELMTLLEALGIGRFKSKGAGIEALRQGAGIDLTPEPGPGPGP